MHTKEIRKNLFLVDLETGGLKNLIASYVLKGNRALIVETGPTSSIPNLLKGLSEIDTKPEDVAYVALTHIHIDHAGGVGTLLKFLPNARVIVHPRGALHLVNPAKLWLQSKEVLGDVAETYGEPEPVPEDRLIIAIDGMTFDVGDGVKLKVVETLGHASHHLSYYESLHGGVFPGDAAGIFMGEFGVVIPTSPPPFRPDIALASLGKLVSLNPSALYYTHFGVASDAVKRLEDYVLQIKLWTRIAVEGVKSGQNPRSIRERILAEDIAMHRLAPFLKLHPIYVKTVLENSIQGFIDFAEESHV